MHKPAAEPANVTFFARNAGAEFCDRLRCAIRNNFLLVTPEHSGYENLYRLRGGTLTYLLNACLAIVASLFLHTAPISNGVSPDGGRLGLALIFGLSSIFVSGFILFLGKNVYTRSHGDIQWFLAGVDDASAGDIM